MPKPVYLAKKPAPLATAANDKTTLAMLRQAIAKPATIADLTTQPEAPENRPALEGKRFISPRHALPVEWVVLRYHRGGAWVCEEQMHKTTCDFYTPELLEATAKFEASRAPSFRYNLIHAKLEKWWDGAAFTIAKEDKHLAAVVLTPEMRALCEREPEARFVCLDSRKVVKAEMGAEVKKGRNIRGNCFYVDCVVFFEDATKKRYQVDSERKKDLPAAIERFQRKVAEGNVSNEDGFFIIKGM